MPCVSLLIQTLLDGEVVGEDGVCGVCLCVWMIDALMRSMHDMANIMGSVYDSES